MEKKKVKFITLGCRVNQYETQGMREALKKIHVESVDDKSEKNLGDESPEYVVINTCTVTNDADRQNRYWVRRMRRDHPHAKIVVTGCGVQRDRDQYDAMSEVDLVILNNEKADIAERLLQSCASPDSQESLSQPQKASKVYSPLRISESEGKTRAFVKIQDGCNHACSFCKVVLVRGRSRSRDLKDIIEEVVRLRDAGYREAVFAGIQLGAYGLDFKGSKGHRLEEVLEACSKIEGIERLRLSSIEPMDVRPSLIQALREIPKCMPHLHIPLQSGDDEVLSAMNRRYARSFYRDLVCSLKEELPDFNLTLDVMAGFPGETDDQYQNTLELLEEIKPLKCHVFPYSSREGTRAARFENVDPKIIRERVRQMLQLEQRLSIEVQTQYLGRVFPVLVENPKVTKQGIIESSKRRQGLTPNFMKVSFEGEWMIPGQMAWVRLTDIQENGLVGEVVEEALQVK